MLSIIASGIGGVGIFFAGMYLLAENLKKLTGSRFRRTVAAWTKSLWAGILWGFAAGAVMQSTSAITFIIVSMLGSGLLTVESGLAILIGANVGATIVVVIATLDIHLFVLVILGVAGLSFAIDRTASARSLLLAIFGIGLVFLGLSMLQQGVAPLANEPWVRDLLASAGSSYLLVFAIAAILTFVTQASTSIALLSITLASAGVLSFEQCVMAIYGLNVGSSVLTFVLSSGLRGRLRQVAMFQVAFNFVAAFLMLPLFYIEVSAGVPLVIAFVKQLSSEQSLQLAYVMVAFNVGGAILLALVIRPTARLLGRLYPPRPEENDAQPQYIYDQAVQEPETALDLVGREQQRLAGYLSPLLDIARTQPKDAVAAVARRRAVIASLASTIDEFLERLGETQLTPSAYERLNHVLNVQRILEGLAETLAELARTAAESGENPTTRRLTGSVVEGVDAVVLTMVEAMAPDGEDDRALLHQMSGNRGALMRRLREEYLESDANLAAADKMIILSLTNLTERASWLISRLAEALPTTASSEAVGAGAGM